MTDVPPGDGDPAGPVDDEPNELRRSTFTPPAEARFDDDSLADAMAAEVAAYTTPITLPGGPAPGSPSAAEPPEERFDLGEVSTLEAIERLESELRRRVSESQPIPVISNPPSDRIFPSPYRPFEPASEHPPTSDIPETADVIDEPHDHSGPDIAASPFAPPNLIEPPALVVPTSTPASSSVPISPPPASEPIDFSLLPPPVGLQAAALPPYQPPDAVEAPPAALDFPPPEGALALAEPPPATGSLAPPVVTDFEALLGATPTFVTPEPIRGVEVDPDSDDDVVDEIDRVGSGAAIPMDADGYGGISAPPSQPIATVRLTADEPALVGEQPEIHSAFEVESAGSEPTALDLRAGRAARLFWLWFAANSSIISLALGATLVEFGMSLRQAIVATLAGVAISFLPLGLGTLAGKWSGQPTMVVSRASFGVVGNVIPAILAIVSRAFWGGVLLWLLAASVGHVLVDTGLDAGLGETMWTLIGLVAGFAIATVVAVFGYGFVARLQLVLSIATGVLIVGAIALTSPHLDIDTALTVGDGPWILVAGGAVLVFSFLGLAWVHSSADLARYQRPDSSGGSSMLWATFGATLPAFLLIGWGAMLAASDPVLAEGLATAPLRTIATLLPAWYPAPLLGAAALGLLSGAVLTIYSGGFALQALGIRARRSVTTVIAAILIAAVAAALTFLAPDAREVLRDVATTLAVPVAAWAGIFAAEMMVRTRRFASASLLTRGGVYPDVRWVNLIGLLLITAVGFGFTTAVLPGLDWQGFFFPFLGIGLSDPIATSDLGVFAALVLGLLLPLVAAVPAIRRQERATD